MFQGAVKTNGYRVQSFAHIPLVHHYATQLYHSNSVTVTEAELDTRMKNRTMPLGAVKTNNYKVQAVVYIPLVYNDVTQQYHIDCNRSRMKCTCEEKYY